MNPIATHCPQCGAPAPSAESAQTGYFCRHCGGHVPAQAAASAGNPSGAAPPANPYGANAPPAANPYANVPPVRPPTPDPVQRTSRRGSFSILGGFIIPAIVGLFAMTPKSCKYITLSEETAAVIKAIDECPKAKKLLGDHVDVPWVGCTTGKSRSGGDTGSGHWSMPIAGDTATGNVLMSLTKKNGTWVLDSGLLTVGDAKVEVVSCKKQ